MSKVVFLNPRTCGIYKDGQPRFKTDAATGERTDQVDNELKDQVDMYLRGRMPPGAAKVDVGVKFNQQVLVPTYYDQRFNAGIHALLAEQNLSGITLGELVDDGTILIRGGHGSPSNDQRVGHIPYVKVSDIRGLRINVNPTNLVSAAVARRMWRRQPNSGLQAWDVMTPNRASSNIGEFAILLPGEEQIVVTKEVFILRIQRQALIDPFYLLWALSLQCVRDQWRRIALMQTNREDCGKRHLEVVLPKPRSHSWGQRVSEPFRTYFQGIADARTNFVNTVSSSPFQHVANVTATVPVVEEAAVEDDAE